MCAYRCYQQEVNMGDNKKPILSVLVDEDKKRLFADLARAHKQSMGWLLNQAIDKMLEAGTIYIYRDSVNPIDGESPKSLPSSDIEEVVRSYVDKAIAPVLDELGYLKKCMDNTATTTAKAPAAIRPAPAQDGVHNEVLKVAKRLEKEPALKSAVIAGLAAGNTGENLGQYLADNGFLNGNGGKYTGASNSRFRLAIEYLNNGGQTND
jgi:hypothetical protein